MLCVLGGAYNEWTRGTVVIEQVQASEPWVQDWDPCDLLDVVCSEEQPVQTAIDAINNALGREVTAETKRRVQYLHDRAFEEGVPFFDAVKTVWCESMWFSQKSMLPEESYGLAQIHLPSHPHITKAQALDAYFSLDFLVERWSDVVWYGYNRASGACANNLQISL